MRDRYESAVNFFIALLLLIIVLGLFAAGQMSMTKAYSRQILKGNPINLNNVLYRCDAVGDQ